MGSAGLIAGGWDRVCADVAGAGVGGDQVSYSGVNTGASGLEFM